MTFSTPKQGVIHYTRYVFEQVEAYLHSNT